MIGMLRAALAAADVIMVGCDEMRWGDYYLGTRMDNWASMFMFGFVAY